MGSPAAPDDRRETRRVGRPPRPRRLGWCGRLVRGVRGRPCHGSARRASSPRSIGSPGDRWPAGRRSRLRRALVGGGPRAAGDRRAVRSERARRPRSPRLSRRAVPRRDRQRIVEASTAARRRASRPPRVLPAASGRSRRDRKGPRAALGGRGARSRTAITDFLLEAGGDLVARGADASGDPWYVGHRGSRRRGRPRGHRRRRASQSRRRRSGSTAGPWTAGPSTTSSTRGRSEPADGGLLAVTVALGGSGLGRGLVEGPVHRRAGRHRGRGPVTRAGGVVGRPTTGSLEMTPAARAMTVWVAAEDEVAARSPG